MAMEHLRRLLQWIGGRRDAWRTPILLVAFTGFSIGCVVSFRRLGISIGDLNPAPLLILAFALVPLTIAYSAVNMMLMGHAAKAPIGFIRGVRITAHAQVAEILPIPGGAIVRAAALVQAGGTLMQSAQLVLGFGLLWIACAACGAGIALLDQGVPAFLLLGGGIAAMLVIHAWLALRIGHANAMAATALRMIGVGLLALRLSVAFSAIGTVLPWITSFTFAFTTILGGAAAIVPSGLGISEALSALLAGAAKVTPADAFLAVAISRLLGLSINLLIAGLFAISSLDRRGLAPGRGQQAALSETAP